MRGTSVVALAMSLVLATAGAAQSTTSAVGRASARTTSSAKSTSLPLYEFNKTGTGALPWTATSLSSIDANTTMIAGPRTAESGAGVNVVAYATSAHSVAFVTDDAGVATFTNLDTDPALPPTADAPVPFFDSLGRLNIVYVATGGHVILVTDNSSPVATLGRASQFLHPSWFERDLTAAAVSTSWPTGVAATGEVAAVASGSNDLFAVRTTANQLVALTVPDQRPFPVTAAVAVAPALTLGSNPVFVGSPVAGLATVAATTSTGHEDIFSQSAPDTWVVTDLYSTIKSPPVAGDLAAAATSTSEYVAGASVGSGDVELDTYSFSSDKWTNTNLTTKTATLATPGPPLAGELALTLVNSTVSVAGAASGWGDLFDYTNTGTKAAWVATDVSATGGSTAKTVGTQVAAVDPSGTVTFFAGGVATPAPPGVGIYDIPSADLGHAVGDGWPILADTGGLGANSLPWVDVPSGATPAALATSIKDSTDFAVGDAIQNSHKRETWLSFWTVSGPNATETYGPGAFKANAFAAGAAVAGTIDQYAANGLGLKPDWVILDPEGYPDNHSQLDGMDVNSVTGNGHEITVTTLSPSSLKTGDQVSLADTGINALNIDGATITVIKPDQFTFPSTVKGNPSKGYLLTTTGRILNSSLYVANWNALMTGWRDGISSVDPSLNAAIYTEESQYAAAGIANTSMPVFMAIAWGNGGYAPVPIAHSSNVLGFIEFGNVCSSGQVQRQLDMFKSSPWNGRYNTVQFEPPGYCKPSTP